MARYVAAGAKGHGFRLVFVAYLEHTLAGADTHFLVDLLIRYRVEMLLELDSVVDVHPYSLPSGVFKGRLRHWDDYWGPRMQAALLALFSIAHAWNANHPENRMGVLHVVFAAFNNNWRHDALQYLPQVEPMGSLALDALLGQFSSEGKNGIRVGW